MPSITLKVKLHTFDIPKIESQNDSFTLINFLVNQWRGTSNEKEKEIYFTEILKLAIPYIERTANKFTKSDKDKEDLIAILSKDLWKLMQKWVDKGLPFHYLMLRQFSNKAINELKHFKCKNICETDLGIEIEQLNIKDDNSILDTLEEKDLVQKLLDSIDDDVTKQLIELVCNGTPLDDVVDCNGKVIVKGIKTKTGKKAVHAMRRRQESCRPKLILILYGSYTAFMNVFMKDITESDERLIMAGYCSGMDTQEMQSKFNFSVNKVREVINKHKPRMMKLLRK